MMWGCCAGTHASSTWQNNGNDYYAPAGTLCVAPISGRVVRAGVPGIGQGERVGIEGDNGFSSYSAHMKNLRVREGQRVKAGDPIGVIWDFLANQGIPDHLHFSMARGSYGGGSFRDPWNDVVACSRHINGKTYESLGDGTGGGGPAPEVDTTPFYVEELSWAGSGDGGGLGPRVLGPWTSRAGRDAQFDQLKSNGRTVTKMGKDGLFYIYDWKPGTYGRAYRWGGWGTAASRDNAKASLESDGRLQNPRSFKEKPNSLYPWI